MFTQIDHIGFAVYDLDAAMQRYRDQFSIVDWDVFALPERHMRAAFAHIGGSAIELIAPTSPAAAFSRFLDTRGEGMHHIAYRVDDIATTLTVLQAQGVRVIDAIARPGLHHTLVAFLHPAACHGTLVELVQHVERR